MKKDLVPVQKDYPINIKDAIVLEDDNIENEEHQNSKSGNGVYPKLSTGGHTLFDSNGNVPLSDEEREQMLKDLEAKMGEMLDILRISRNDPNSMNTPERVAKMYINEIFSGRFEEAPKITVFPNRNHVNNLVISRGIKVMSLCAHHWMPISGHCYIGYIPKDHVIGLSKLTRITNWFSRRGQIQEELGEQIADYLEKILKPKALGVVIDAKHYCMIARGVSADEDSSITTTSVMRGYLLDDMNLRNEFLKLIKH